MKVERTAIDGVIIIKPDMHGDARGFFVETWQRDRYADAGDVYKRQAFWGLEGQGPDMCE